VARRGRVARELMDFSRPILLLRPHQPVQQFVSGTPSGQIDWDP
jgi:hypothetical protein